MMDHRRTAMRAHARLGQWKSRRAERALGRHAADEPVRPAAAGAMIDFLFAVNGVIAAALRVVSHLQIAECRNASHIQSLSVDSNG